MQSAQAVEDAHNGGLLIKVDKDIPEEDEVTGVSQEGVARLHTTGSDKSSSLPFLLGRTVGAGSFGKVKLGTLKADGTQVAIKIIPRERITSSKLQANIEREVKMMKLLRNEHIVRLYDVVVSPTKIYLAMEYAPDGDLLAFINSRARLGEDKAGSLFVQVVDGVAFCHKLGVCHRDLKLENLLLNKGVVKIADFGLANYAPPPTMDDDSAFMNTHCGSPLYAAPELLRNRDAYDATKVDIWSLGVVLYALVNKALPFEGAGLPEIMRKIVTVDYKIPEGLSPELADLISSMLSLDPASRPSIDGVQAHPWCQRYLQREDGDAAVERTTSFETVPTGLPSWATGALKADETASSTGAVATGGGERKRPATLNAADLAAELSSLTKKPLATTTTPMDQDGAEIPPPSGGK